MREHFLALAQRSDILPGIADRAFVDIDSLLCPVYGPRQPRRLLRALQDRRQADPPQRRPPLATIISTADSAPVIAGMRLRAGKAGSGTGAARTVAQAVTTARMAGTSGKIMVRGDFAYGNSRVVRACINAHVEFSFVPIKTVSSNEPSTPPQSLRGNA